MTWRLSGPLHLARLAIRAALFTNIKSAPLRMNQQRRAFYLDVIIAQDVAHQPGMLAPDHTMVYPEQL